MLYRPYDFQQEGIDDIVAFLTSAKPGDARGYVAPTGTGKSSIHAGCLERLPGLYLTVPTVEIALGVYRALGHPVDPDWSEEEIRKRTEAQRIYTVKRLAGLLTKGTIDPPAYLAHDEGHHAIDDTHTTIRELCGNCPFIVLTATDYRGTPVSTAALHKAVNYSWTKLITLGDRKKPDGSIIPGSISRGFNSLPEFRTLPLLDDEMIDVSGGEFVVKSVESMLTSRLAQIIEVLRNHYDPATERYSLPGTVVLSSAGAVSMVSEAMTAAGLPNHAVLAATKGRQQIFRDTIDRTHLLIQCKVVGEGVDLPLRWMLDLSPTMSPVLWMQRVGRIMRPVGGICSICGYRNNRPFHLMPAEQQWCLNRDCGKPTVFREPPPLYLGACHNLTRHGYLFEGLVPPAAFIEARKVWGKQWKPSRRMLARALGNTGFGRFEPTEVPLANGETAMMYVLKAERGLESYAALLVPSDPEPRYYQRIDVYTGETAKFSPRPGLEIEYQKKERGKWERVKALPELKGASSYPPEALQPGQVRWWSNQASRRGLNGDAEVNAKNWMALPILSDTGERLGGYHRTPSGDAFDD